ncbi:MAG: DEAD/DEAH box helicase family protein [Magnetococcales bacterium]|nr:DEAD/DEAH box helicase family protein [Magnetococcales bacterium]
MITIRFDQGTLVLTGAAHEMEPVAAHVQWDERSRVWRAEGRRYGPILLTLHRLRHPFQDEARRFETRHFVPRKEPPPRPHQRQALDAWIASGRKGVVVLPTGAGKTLVARMAIVQTQRDALILVPTLDLLQQWRDQLVGVFGEPIGVIGGGAWELAPITVCTYDSAALRMDALGDRFGLLICDECHHLAAQSTQTAARMAIAPFRLGLTATPERSDGGEEMLYDLLGPLCHRCEITELEGAFLAPYHLESVAVTLDPDERQAYDDAYALFRRFTRENGISFGRPDGWSLFIKIAARSREGREAFAAWREQKRLARASRAKLRMVWKLLHRHRRERVILFTDDNETAYTIGETFFLPVITHHTRMAERKALLEAFRRGEVAGLVNSRVLNEGVDVPDASVGIIVSGSGSVREHVQRLGRILRPVAGKEAILYELVSEDTAETFTSERRRRHVAYQREGAA